MEYTPKVGPWLAELTQGAQQSSSVPESAMENHIDPISTKSRPVTFGFIVLFDLPRQNASNFS